MKLEELLGKRLERPARLAQALHEEAAARGILLQLRRKPASRDAKAKKTGGGNP